MIQSKHFFFLFTVLTLSFPANSAEYYSWVDENGVPNFGEKIPVGFEGQKVKAVDNLSYKPDPSATKEGSQSLTENSESGDQKNEGDEIDITEETKKVEAEIAEVKRSNCEIGKRNLAQLSAYARIKMRGKDGEDRVIGEDEKQSKIDEARKIIADNCSG